jgi:hypothetical protein
LELNAEALNLIEEIVVQLQLQVLFFLQKIDDEHAHHPSHAVLVFFLQVVTSAVLHFLHAEFVHELRGQLQHLTHSVEE